MSWPSSGNDTPTRTAVKKMEAAAADVHSDLRHERNEDQSWGLKSEITLADLRDVRDRTGAIWYLRKLAMERRDEERAAYVKRYRPIQTLDGLDPHLRPRVSRSGLLAVVHALMEVLYG